MVFAGRNGQGRVSKLSRLRTGSFEGFRQALGYRITRAEECCLLECKNQREFRVRALDQLIYILKVCLQASCCYLLKLDNSGRGNFSRISKTPDVRASRLQEIRKYINTYMYIL